MTNRDPEKKTKSEDQDQKKGDRGTLQQKRGSISRINEERRPEEGRSKRERAKKEKRKEERREKRGENEEKEDEKTRFEERRAYKEIGAS